MIKPFLFLVSMAVVLLCSCSKDKENACYDAELEANHSGICTTDCPGVTGCDGNFYCNECNANAVGIVIVDN